MKLINRLLLLSFVLLFPLTAQCEQTLIEQIDIFQNCISPDSTKLVFSITKPKLITGILNLISGEVYYPSLKIHCTFISPTWTSDSKSIIYWRVPPEKITSKIFIYSLLANKEKRVGDSKYNTEFETAYFPSFSPNGKYVCFLRWFGNFEENSSKAWAGLMLFDRTTGKEMLLTKLARELKFSPIWLPDSKRILYYEIRGKGLYQISIISKKKELLISEDQLKNKLKFLFIPYTQINSLGNKISFLLPGKDRRNQEIWIMDILKKYELKKTGSYYRWLPYLSSSFSKVVHFDSEGHIYVYNCSSRQTIQLTFGENYDFCPIWTWDENKIIFIRNKNTIWTMNADGGNQHQIFPKPKGKKIDGQIFDKGEK